MVTFITFAASCLICRWCNLIGGQEAGAGGGRGMWMYLLT